MADIDRNDIRGNIALMVLGGAIGLLCVVLLIAGGGPGLWFTAAGMALLVLSQWMTIRAKRRRH